MSLEGLGKYLYVFVEWTMAFFNLRNRTCTTSTMKRIKCLLELVARQYREKHNAEGVIQLTRMLHKLRMHVSPRMVV